MSPTNLRREYFWGLVALTGVALFLYFGQADALVEIVKAVASAAVAVQRR